jgi:hypothetical protein
MTEVRRNISYAWTSIVVTLRIRKGHSHISIIGVYAPCELQKVMDRLNKNDYILIIGNLNARVGNNLIPDCMEIYGESTSNENGKMLKDFCTFNNLRITNPYFKNKDCHKYNWEARDSKSAIYYIIISKKIKSYVTNVRLHRGSEISTDHYLSVSSKKLPQRCTK